MSSISSLLRPLLAGLAIREALAPWTGHPFDFEIWVRLGVFLQSGGSPYSLLPFYPGVSFAPYPEVTSISYPPLPAFIFALTYKLYALLGTPSQYVYYFLLKQPMILSDLLIAVFLYKILLLKGSGQARNVALIWLFFPFGIIVSSMWGALDPIALVLVLASIYAYMTGRWQSSAILLGVATFLKIMPIVFLPLFLMDSKSPSTRKGTYAAIAIAIPVIGTVLPVVLLGWGFSGLYSAVSYQGSLSSFGGLGVFNALELIRVPSQVGLILGLLWVPALLISYVQVFRRKFDLVEGSLLVFLTFAIFRPVMPEQWALYPVSFLLLMGGKNYSKNALALGVTASAYLAINNLLLVRFFSPVSTEAFVWDQLADSASAISEFRLALLLIFSALFSAEALSILLRRNSLITLKFRQIMAIRPRDLGVPVTYMLLIAVTGGILDFTATKMVTNWALAIQSDVFLGQSWLSLYHIMLVMVFETSTVLIVLFARKNLSESLGLLVLLTSLNFAASAISLVLYRFLDGEPILSGIPIYLMSSIYITERGFVVFAITLGGLGIFFLNEFRSSILSLLRGLGQIGSRGLGGSKDASSLPSPS